VGTGTKEDESSTGHVWAAGFHHVTAHSRLMRILKLVKSFHGVSGFGGLVVSMLASGTRPKPSDFSGRKNPQHAFLRRGSKAVCPMSQFCGM
jgi:hypothetical protein